MIRSAKADEANILTKISFDSKAYWNYPQEYFEVWKDELSVSSDYIEKNGVFVFEVEGTIVGYYSIVDLPEDIEISGVTIKKGYWLQHMFVDPGSIGKGIGSSMFHHLRNWCGRTGIKELSILADPHSKGFYEKMGCQYVGEFPSTIKDRTTPHLICKALNS